MKTLKLTPFCLVVGALGVGMGISLAAPAAPQGSDSSTFLAGTQTRLNTGPSAAEEASLHLRRQNEDLVPSVAQASIGLAASREGLRGGGPGFKVAFGAGGFSFTPALGAKVERNHPLSFVLDSMRRGGNVFFTSDGMTKARMTGNVAVFDHGDGLREQYEVVPEGVEQSFVFDAIPNGKGDLIVRGVLTTDLQFKGESDGGLRFEHPGAGGVTIGAVTGIDAAGLTAPGTVRLDGEYLELSLPAAFLDKAVPPLTLDPLIGSGFGVSFGSDDGSSDVAYDSTNDLYLVVWQRTFSALDTDIVGQRIDPRGSLLGGTLFIESSFSTVSLEPTVAGVSVTNRFLVAWQEGPSVFGPWEIKAVAVNASDGVLSKNNVTLSSGAGVSINPDAGGESTSLDDGVVVVWEDIALGIQGRAVDVPMGNSDPVNQAVFSLSTNTTDTEPAISKSGGMDGQYLVVWQRFMASPFPGDLDVMGAVVDRTGAVSVTTTQVTSQDFNDEKASDVDGDGRSWMIVFESEVVPNVGDSDIHCKTADLTMPTLSVAPGETVLEADANDDEIHPSVADAGEKFFVTWSDEVTAFDYDLRGVGVDPVTCGICEPEFNVDTGGTRDDHPSMASQLSGDLNGGDQVMLVWQSADLAPPFDSEIDAQLLEAIGSGGSATALGGSCGQGGSVSVIGPLAVGNSTLRVDLNSADPTAILAIFNLNVGGLGTTSCGTCELTAFGTLYQTTIVGGSASLDIPIPCVGALVGQELEGQWGILGSNGGDCAFLPNLSVSDRIGITLGL